MFDSEPLASLALLALATLTITVLRRFHVQAVADLPVGGVSRQMANIIFLVAMGHVGLFMLIPAVLRPLTGWADDLDLGVNRSEIVYVYLIELVSFATWAGGFVLVWRGRGLAENARQQGNADEKMGGDARLFLIMVLGLGIWRLVDIYVFGGSPVFDPDKSDFQARWGWLVGPLADLSGTVVGLYVLALGRAKVGRALWSLALIGVAAFAATIGSNGIRGTAIWPLFWWMLLVALHRKRREWIRLTLPALAILVPLFLYNEYYREKLPGVATQSGLAIGEKLAALRSGEAEASDLIGSSAFRLGCASRYSVAFVRMWQTDRGALWNPIANTLYAPLPRRFFPDKPWPTSLRGDQYSAGMYLCVSEFTPFQNFTMTEFLTGSHAYWEFGWAGVFGLSLVGGMVLAFIAGLLRKMGAAGPAIVLLFFKPWGYNNPKLWFSDLMLEIVQIGPATFLLWTVSRHFGRPGRDSRTETPEGSAPALPEGAA
jgi:hypothetical protein